MNKNEHNAALQQTQFFTATDLEANRKGQYSQAQLERAKESREYVQQNYGKYENKGWLISLIFGGFLLLLCSCFVLPGCDRHVPKHVGESLFAGHGWFMSACRLVRLRPLLRARINPQWICTSPWARRSRNSRFGAIQVIKARAEAYKSQGGINRRGHQSSRVSYILQMDSIKFIISRSLDECHRE